jgi:hypothetical protein
MDDRAHAVPRPLLRGGWTSAAHWGVAGALVVYAFLGMWTIGFFIMPFAVWACYHASARYRFLPEGASGLMLGAAAVFVFLAFLSRNYVPCQTGGVIVFAGDTAMHSCGGSDPLPRLRVGATLSAIGIAIYCVGFWVRSRYSRA